MSDTEKTYRFTINRGIGTEVIKYKRKESELTNAELDILAGELLYEIRKAPILVQQIIKRELEK